MLITFSTWTACSAAYAKTESPASGTAVAAMIFLFYGVAGTGWPGLTVSYTIEILPYNIRAKVSRCAFASRLSAACSTSGSILWIGESPVEVLLRLYRRVRFWCLSLDATCQWTLTLYCQTCAGVFDNIFLLSRDKGTNAGGDCRHFRW